MKQVTPEGFSMPRHDRAAKSETRNPKTEGRPNSEIRRCGFPLNRGTWFMHRLALAVSIQLEAPFPLTPAISPRERETGGSAGSSSVAGGCFLLVGIDFCSFGEAQSEGEFDDYRHEYASSRARAAISDFGLRFSFGFRPSGFGFQQSPPP